MAIGTPALALSPNPGASAATYTSASFTVTAGVTIFALTMSRGGSAQPTITDSLGGTWTPLSAGVTMTSFRTRVYYKVSTGAAQTITIAATGASAVAGSLVSISGVGTDFSNYQEGTNTAGDPSVTLSAMSSSTSAALYLAAAFGASAFAVASGYTELNDGGPATNCRVLSGYDLSSPGVTIAVTSTNTDAVLFGLELKPPPGTADAWNVNEMTATLVLSSSDKVATNATGTSTGVRSTQTYANGTAGKYYAEFLITSPAGRPTVGITPLTNTFTALSLNMFVPSNGDITINSVAVGSVGALVSGDIISVAWDSGAELIWFRRNAGNWNATAGHDPATGTGGFDASFAPATQHALWMTTSVNGAAVTLRTELAEYTQAVPSGFKSWMGETPAVTLAGMKVWSGSAWAEKPVKVWSGSAWATKPVKVWNGSAWV